MASLEQGQECNQDYLRAVDANMSLYNTLEAMDAVEQDPPKKIDQDPPKETNEFTTRKKISVNDISKVPEAKEEYEKSKSGYEWKLKHWLKMLSDNIDVGKDSYLKILLNLFEDSNKSDWVVYNGKSYSPEEFFGAIRKWTIKIANIESTVNNAKIDWSDNAYAILGYGQKWSYKPLIERLKF